MLGLVSFKQFVNAFEAEGFVVENKLAKWMGITSSEGPKFFLHKEQGAEDRAKSLKLRRYRSAYIICDPRWDGVAKLEKVFGPASERTAHNLTAYPSKRNKGGDLKPYGAMFPIDASRIAEFAGLVRETLLGSGLPDQRADALDHSVDADSSRLAGDSSSSGDVPPALPVEELDAEGYESDPIIRREIEKYAMERAVEHYSELGQVVVVGKPYDLDCHARSEHFRVEVKGTRGAGRVVIVTRNEVKHARRGDIRVELFLLSNIDVTINQGRPTATGGRKFIIDSWQPVDADLDPIQFNYRLPNLVGE